MPLLAKPAVYEVDDSAALCPDHLFMIDEGASTTLTDIGKGASLANGTITGADWAADATHGPVLSFVRANSDYVSWASVLGCSTSGTVVAAVKIPASQGVTAAIACFANTATANQLYSLEYNASDRLQSAVQNTTLDNDSITTPLVADAAWHLVAFTVQDNLRKIGFDGAAFQSDTFSVVFAGVPTEFALGRRHDSTPSNYAQMEVAALWVYPDTVLSDGDFAALWNSGDPWATFLSYDPRVDSVTPDTFEAGDAVVLAGVNFSPTGNTIDLDGVAQTITAEDTEEITFTAVLGAGVYGPRNLLVSTAEAISAPSVAVTLTPAADEAYWDLGTLGATATQLLTAIPDLVDGAQVHGLELRDATATPIDITLVTIELDGSISLDASITDPTGYELDVRANNRDGEGWGAVATVTLTVSLGEAAPAHGARMATLGGIMVR